MFGRPAPGVAAHVRELLARPHVRDVLLAVWVAVAALAVMATSGEAEARAPDLLGVAFVAAGSAPLLVWRRWPVGVLVAVFAVTSLMLALDYPGGSELPLRMAALYGAMAEGRRSPALAVFVLFVGGGVAYQLLVERDDPLLVVITVSLLGLVVLLGDASRTRRRLRAETAERLRVLEAEKEHEAREQVTAERLRIARELHDVLAHTITAITVQASAAADGLDEGSEAHTAMRSMRTTAQEAMQQLQATIAVLRSDHDRRAPLDAPDLSGLSELVASAWDAGLEVAVRRQGAVRRLPAAVELTAYRIVQEALTNVVRHADADHAGVQLHYGRDTLRVTVVDDGRDTPALDGTNGDAHGYGLRGMRERAQALGGELLAGPASGGGFRVEAILPARRDGA